MNMKPIVIFGGFLTFSAVYHDMRQGLIDHTGQPVWIVHTRVSDWLLSVRQRGWAVLLDKLDRTVRGAQGGDSDQKITLVGHSAGGVLARLYLSPTPFLGRAYNGLERVERLITLGSPHHSLGGLRRGGNLARWMDAHYPGATFSPPVEYITVAGKWLRGSQFGTRLSRWLYREYREIGGDGAAWGDGVTPVDSALLEGAQQVILEQVSHYALLDEKWYGSREVIPQWWPANTPDTG